MTSKIQQRMTELEDLVIDNRDSISDRTGVPFVVFTYDPDKELKMEEEIDVFLDKLEHEGIDAEGIDMRDTFFSLLEKEGILDRVIDIEKEDRSRLSEGLNSSFFEEVEGQEGTLIEEILNRVEGHDVAIMHRAGILYPFTSISIIFSNLENKVDVPIVAFYPAENDDGVMFLGETESSYYRPRVI